MLPTIQHSWKTAWTLLKNYKLCLPRTQKLYFSESTTRNQT